MPVVAAAPVAQAAAPESHVEPVHHEEPVHSEPNTQLRRKRKAATSLLGRPSHKVDALLPGGASPRRNSPTSPANRFYSTEGKERPNMAATETKKFTWGPAAQNCGGPCADLRRHRQVPGQRPRGRRLFPPRSSADRHQGPAQSHRDGRTGRRVRERRRQQQAQPVWRGDAGPCPR